MATNAPSTLPPDLFDQTTLVSLASIVVLVTVAYGTSKRVLAPSTPGSLRFLFIWHAFDALCHFCVEGGFLYHCFFSYLPLDKVSARDLVDGRFYLTPHFLGHKDRVYGPQAGEDGPLGGLAGLWMVYARADKRWAGADLGVVALELLTVLVVAPLCCVVCYDLAKKNPRANILMIMIATAELYGGFMTFCPEWLTLNQNLDSSNFMYLWLYLVFFNMLWVFIPIYAVYVSILDISNAFAVRAASLVTKKSR